MGSILAGYDDDYFEPVPAELNTNKDATSKDAVESNKEVTEEIQ